MAAVPPTASTEPAARPALPAAPVRAAAAAAEPAATNVDEPAEIPAALAAGIFASRPRAGIIQMNAKSDRQMPFINAVASAAVLVLATALPAMAQSTYPPVLDCTQYHGPRAANCRNMTELQQNNPANRR